MKKDSPKQQGPKVHDFTHNQADQIIKKKFDFSVLARTLGEIKTGFQKIDKASSMLKRKQQKNYQKFFKQIGKEQKVDSSESDDDNQEISKDQDANKKLKFKKTERFPVEPAQ